MTYSYDRRTIREVNPPETGQWPFDGFPKTVQVAGRTFHKATFQTLKYDVIAQYREDSPTDSAHLTVMKDRTWRIEHIDEYNPDQGQSALHMKHDMGLYTT